MQLRVKIRLCPKNCILKRQNQGRIQDFMKAGVRACKKGTYVGRISIFFKFSIKTYFKNKLCGASQLDMHKHIQMNRNEELQTPSIAQ